MMKLISIVLSFLFGSQTAKNWDLRTMALEIFDEALLRSRKPIVFLMLGFTGAILFCGGFLISLFNISEQLDMTGQFIPGAVFWSGIILSSIILLGQIYAFTSIWPTHFLSTNEKQELPNPTQGHNIQEALSLLILDHIEERKVKRAQSTREYSKSQPSEQKKEKTMDFS